MRLTALPNATAVILILSVLASALLRLVPESSPLSRAAGDKNIYQCLTCHGKTVDGTEFASDSCVESDELADHPDFDGICEDYLAFFASVRLQDSFPERLASNPSNRLVAGEHLARMFYCFQCHGEMGQGGFPNEGALKGYVPGYFGKDFLALTDGAAPDAVRSWIRDGVNPRLLDRTFHGPLAAYFIRRQAVQMPTFDSLSELELDLLVDYVTELHSFGPMNVRALREYEQRTRLPVTDDRELFFDAGTRKYRYGEP